MRLDSVACCLSLSLCLRFSSYYYYYIVRENFEIPKKAKGIGKWHVSSKKEKIVSASIDAQARSASGLDLLPVHIKSNSRAFKYLKFMF